MKSYAVLLAGLAFALVFAAPAMAAQICLVPSPNGVNGTVDCDPGNPQLHDNGVTGYSTQGAPCSLGFCGFEPARSGLYDYHWSISASESDPNVNSGPLPVGVVFLNLWLYCFTVEGWTAAEMSVESDDSSLFIIAFTPWNGVLNAGSGLDLLLVVGGCPQAPFLAGQFVILNTGTVSVDAETWGGIKAMYR